MFGIEEALWTGEKTNEKKIQSEPGVNMIVSY